MTGSCVICGTPLRTVQLDLDQAKTTFPMFCKKCVKPIQCFLYTNQNKYLVITHGKYNAIRRTLRKKSSKSCVLLPYMPPSRVLCLNPNLEMRFLLEEYAQRFYTKEDNELIESWESDMDELTEEIEGLQEDLGDIERKIKNYPLDTLKVKVV